MKYLISGEKFTQAVKLVNEIKPMISNQVAARKMKTIQDIFSKAHAAMLEIESNEKRNEKLEGNDSVKNILTG